MKKLFFCLIALTNQTFAAGLDWSAYDQQQCKVWYFDVGAPENYAVIFKKKYGEEPPEYQSPPADPENPLSHWSEIQASINGKISYATCFFSGETPKTVKCKPYGETPFPLGSGLFIAETVKPNTWEPSYSCIKNCETALVKVFFDHGWESELKDHPTEKSLRKAIEKCESN